MGNICRSPTAESVFRSLVTDAGLAGKIAVDSAATHDYQLGEAPDPRAVAHARRRGYELGGRCARQIESDDFGRFEWILAMDRTNLRALEELRPLHYKGYLGLLLDFVPELSMRDVPDPYDGEAEDFERVLDLVERGAAALLIAVQDGLTARERQRVQTR
jgi:protein-tyrosine phosphatase